MSIINGVNTVTGLVIWTSLSVTAGGQIRFLARRPVEPPGIVNPRRVTPPQPPYSPTCCRGAWVSNHDPADTISHESIDTIPYIVPYPVYVGSQGYANLGEPPGADPPDSPNQETQSISASPPPSPLEFSAVPMPSDFRRQETAVENSCPLNTSSPDQADQVRLLIALKDNRVHTAVAYWVFRDTLHYITPRGIHNQVSLQLVNRKLSAQLNSGGIVQLILPPE